MLLDGPGKFLYRHHVNTYKAMRVFCTDYRYIIVSAVTLAAVLVIVWLARPSTLAALGIIH